MSRVLVVDPDADVVSFIGTHLEVEGFEVASARTGLDAISAIDALLPDVVLLDVLLGDISGLEVCRRLRSHRRTASLPVIMVSALSEPGDRVVGLLAGADDYVIKPFDLMELTARVRSLLRRNAEMRAVSPLTGLPGNHRIDRELADRVRVGEPFAVCYFDLDSFKAFNDIYGFLRGDQMISALADCLVAAGGEVGDPQPFLGHVGGDDFVVVCQPDRAEALATRVIELFDEARQTYLGPEDVARGSLEVTDRQGNRQRHPLTAVSVGIALSERRTFTDHREIVEVAAEMKGVAKRTEGSSIAVDRRGD